MSANGDYGVWFKCKRSIRQGNTIFSYLFSLAKDPLSMLLSNAKNAKHFEGVGEAKILQYIDDTLIFIQGGKHFFAVIKLILNSFEIVSGLAISFSKSLVAAVDPKTFVGNFFSS